jgi:hypothetical protein
MIKKKIFEHVSKATKFLHKNDFKNKRRLARPRKGEKFLIAERGNILLSRDTESSRATSPGEEIKLALAVVKCLRSLEVGKHFAKTTIVARRNLWKVLD